MIYVVSGLPRSGTSMMMKMLNAGGMETVTDQARQPDPDNPDGYFEYAPVKNLAVDAGFIRDIHGKAIKVVSPLLRFLPRDQTYKILFMLRPLEEIMLSQEKMLMRKGETASSESQARLQKKFQDHLYDIRLWIARQPFLDCLFVSYPETVADPPAAAGSIVKFLSAPCDAKNMAAVVAPQLYRNRETSPQNGLSASRLIIPAVLTALILWAETAHAYIGPGAGFAVISSFLVFVVTGFLSVFTILFWPFRAGLLYFRRRLIRAKRKVRRVVVLGLDGLDPGLAKNFMDAGLLPNFSRLAAGGAFRPLATTKPSISPVAWSSFATGVNPGKHRIFDFYTRDIRTYLPVLSSVEIATVKSIFRLGPIRIPRSRTAIRFLRKAVSFWNILGRHGIFSTVLRVPISFPPEKCYGASLSAMCAPDLRGTQGAFTCFCSQTPLKNDGFSEGAYIPVEIQGDRFTARIPGLRLPGGASTDGIDMAGRMDGANHRVHLHIAKEPYVLTPGEYSPWIKLVFRAGFMKKITGIVRFLLVHREPEFRLYMSPINIDPEKPALPVSYPFYYAAILSKLYGPFSTLGLSEDTWALNEGVIGEQDFLNQAYDIYEDRKKHFMDALQKNKEGLVISVFDTTDRIQHMFFRYLDESHPANAGKDTIMHKLAIQELYQRMDGLAGEVVKQIRADDLLMIISDHGFTQFKWGVNLNTWLLRNGYLALKPGAEAGGRWLKDVDWSKTRAYAFGLTGIFINLKGRESQGIVSNKDERLKLQLELKEKIEALVDPGNGRSPVRRAMLARMHLKGPYVDDAPDLIIGYDTGYRASWNCAVGMATDQVIEPNTRHWSGDHSVDPDLVPGVFFSNWKLKEDDPAIIDIAPTIQRLFGLSAERHQDGRPLDFVSGSKPI